MSRDLFLLNSDFHAVVSDVLSTVYSLGVEMRPYFTVRDPWTQAKLWRQSRSIEEITEAIHTLEIKGALFLAHLLRSVGPQFGDHVTDALPGLSWHQWGEAVDCYWYFNGAADWSTQRKIRISDGREINGYRLYGEIAAQKGLTSGGFWSSLVDWPHIQKRSGSILDFFTWPEIDKKMQERFGQGPAVLETAELTTSALEIGPFAAEAVPQDNFVRVKGDKFCIKNHEFKFVGVNIRGLVHYGAHYSHGPGMPFPMINMDSQVRDHPQEAQLKLAYSFGARVVRVFLAHKLAETEEIIARFKQLLDIIKALGFKDLYLLPALTNFYDSVPFHVRGDNGEINSDHRFYQNGRLSADWYHGGYQQHYQPFVEKVVNACKNSPHILAWEIGNELAIGPVPGMSDRAKAELVTDFMRRMARIIKEIDRDHLITTGMTGTAKAWMHTNGSDNDVRRRLYEPFDFVTLHYPRDEPNGFGRNADDAKLARDLLHKPYIIEEDLVCQVGFQNHLEDISRGCQPCDHRAMCFKNHLEKWLGRENNSGDGASGYMIWGFDPARINDDDPGGIGAKNPPDWSELRTLFSDYAEALSQRMNHTNL